MLVEKAVVGVAKAGALATEALHFTTGQDHGHGFPSAGELDFESRFGLVDNDPEAGSRFGDGVGVGHNDMYNIMYISKSKQPSRRLEPTAALASRRRG